MRSTAPTDHPHLPAKHGRRSARRMVDCTVSTIRRGGLVETPQGQQRLRVAAVVTGHDRDGSRDVVRIAHHQYPDAWFFGLNLGGVLHVVEERLSRITPQDHDLILS